MNDAEDAEVEPSKNAEKNEILMRVVLVTGGGRGIGRAIALGFASPDAIVAVASRTASQLAATVRDIEARGGRAVALTMDVTDEASVDAAFERLGNELGTDAPQIGVLVNNAGVGGGEPIVGSDAARWRQTLDVNLFGMYLVSRAAVALMPDEGRVINLSSVLGRFGVPGYTAYCASKHGVIGFTRALALELAPRRITVNAICPGWVDTEMATQGMQLGADATGVSLEKFRSRALNAVPLKRIIAPAEIAGLAQFLASPAAAMVTGQAYNICGGQTMD